MNPKLKFLLVAIAVVVMIAAWVVLFDNPNLCDIGNPCS